MKFLLQMATGVIEDKDVLTIRLPVDENNYGYQFVAGRAFCEVQAAISVRSCSIDTIYEAKMTFKVTSNAQNEQGIEGSIRNFKNPDSTQEISGIQFELADLNGKIKAAYYSGELGFFKPTSLKASLSSSSSVVGDTRATLTVTVTPKYILPSAGSIEIEFPEYYPNAGTHYMIDTTAPSCSAQSTISVLSCKFTKSTRRVKLDYSFKNGINSYLSATFYIKDCLNNPIEPKDKAGFFVFTSDSNGQSVGVSESITLSGVTTPNTLSYVTFNLDRGTNVVGQLNALQMTIGQNVPLVDSCYIKFVFPKQFVLDSNLYEATGTSYFLQKGSSSNLVPFYKIDRSKRELVVKACEAYNGQNNIGSISFNKIQNPSYVIGTDSFQITLARDEYFQQVIVNQSSNIYISESQWSAGTIYSGKVVATNPHVSATTNLEFTFTPPTKISIFDGSQIRVQIPPLLHFTSCKIINRNSFVNSLATCGQSGNLITIQNAFNREFPGNQEINLQLSSFTNPISARDVGDFTIQTFLSFNGMRLVDQVTLKNQIMTEAGLITPSAYTEVSSLETYDVEGIYIFKMSFEHAIPRGSTIKVYLPDGMKIGNPTVLRANCYRLDKTIEPQKLFCEVDLESKSFLINVDTVFGASGLPAGENFRLQVSGILNPRVSNKGFMFYFESLDSLKYVIDKSRDDDRFLVSMTDIGQIQLISAAMDNQTNGAPTQYNIRIYPNTPIFDGDRLTFNLPVELTLPTQSTLSCSQSKNIRRIVCTKQGNNKVQVVFESVNNIQAGDAITIYIDGIRNAPSLRPTSSFQNFLLTDQNSFQIADYSGDVSVTNTQYGYIRQYSLLQGTKEPGEETDYTIRFTTNNALPYSTAMLVRIPTEVTLIKSSGDCTVLTNTIRSKVCQFTGDKMIKVTNAFGDQANVYKGTVEIKFRAVNPPTNENKNITLKLDIYDDSSLNYMIDVIVGGLNPTFQCNYPCQTCDYKNPDFCLSCPKGNYEPNFLQPVGLLGQTCETVCRQSYTYNILSDTKICTPCHPSCKTCRIGVDINDWEVCLECADDYPYFWAEFNKCYAKDMGCPVGSYEKEKYECLACFGPCQECRHFLNCTLCKPESRFPLLQNDRCVQKCKEGFTPVFTTTGKGQCLPCELPCATCFDGLPAKCLTCALGDRQFKFGSQCVAECPLGTAIDLVKKECSGCRETCEQCSVSDNSLCLLCKEGLALLNNECYAECPVQYLKSSDSKTCELRQYPFNKYYVPFPFLMLLTLFYLIIWASYIITKKATLVFQNMMVATSIVLILAIGVQTWLAMFEGNQPLTIVFCIVILLANLIINIAYYITFKIQIDDYRFNQYMQYHFVSFKAITALNLVVSLHTFRLCYGKLFALPMFHAATTSPAKFYKPLLLYSLIQISCVCAPVCLSNIFFAGMNRSLHITDNQLQCTTVELIIISFIMSGLVIYERYFQHPRYINFRPDHDAVHIFQSVFGNATGAQNVEELKKLAKSGKLNRIQQVNGKIVDLNQTDRMPLVEDKLDRHKELRQILGLVRGKKDTNLNASLDLVMNDEIRPQLKKQDSQPSLRLKPIVEDDSQPDPLNLSWEGAPKQWENDGASKRLELLTYMENQLQLAAEKERQEFEQREREKRFQEKEQMYDNQMFDNVFFSAKSKRENEAQAVTTFHEMEAQYSDRDAVVNFQTLLQKNEDGCEEAERKAQLKAEKKKAKLERLKQKKIQTDTVEFKSTGSLQNRSPRSNKLVTESQLSSASPSENEEDTSFEAEESKAQVKKNTKRQSSKTLSKKTVSQRTKTQQKQQSESQKSKTAPKVQTQQQNPSAKQPPIESSKNSQTSQLISRFGDSAIFSEESQSIREPQMFSQDDMLQGEEVSNMIGHGGDSMKLQSLQVAQGGINDRNPGPETVKWIKRVRLMKTLMLDERDPATRPGQKIREEIVGSQTDPTQNGGGLYGPNQEPKIIEDLVDTDECASKDDAIDNPEDSVSTIGDDIVRKEALANEWEKENAGVHSRNFNIFSILGNFPLTKEGRIENRAQVLEEMNYRDHDGLPVNNRGYLINETTGAIYSKYSFEDLFMPLNGHPDDFGEIPMPYRLERYNFNGHAVMGNFDFDSKSCKPIFLKNKFGMLTDKNYRPVNKCGFLINEQEDIIDDNGEIKLAKCMLTEAGDLPPLYNYSGVQYKITDIIGRLTKDDNSKELCVKVDKRNNRAIDELGRSVNANGYLIDTQGNIVNFKNERIWNFWELLYQEPPKIFSFTEWSLDWIKGNVQSDKDLNFGVNQDMLHDFDNRLINVEGYLIDRSENVIDKYGRIVFKNDLLTLMKGQDAKIPLVFTKNLLLKPEVSRLRSPPHSPTKQQLSIQTSENKLKTAVGTSFFNLQDCESANASTVKAQENPTKKQKMTKKKAKPAYRRQNSEAMQRPGAKIKNMYQAFLENISDQNYSQGVQTISGQVIQPVQLSHTPTMALQRQNSRQDNFSINQTQQEYQQSEQNRRRYNSTQRMFGRNSGPQPFASAANLSLGMSKTPSALGVPVGLPRPRVNQLVRDPSPVPLPRQGASRVPDNSYQARASEIFKERMQIAGPATPEYVSGLNFYQAQRNESVNESKVNITQQLAEVNNIYGRLRKRKPHN